MQEILSSNSILMIALVTTSWNREKVRPRKRVPLGLRCATLADCRLADLESQHNSSSYPKSFLKSAKPPLRITCLPEFPHFRSKQT